MTTIDFTDSAVAIDPKGARYIAQEFKFPDGTKGMMIILKPTRRPWKSNITNVTINYAKD